jgi:large subunit ribosomal protein L23
VKRLGRRYFKRPNWKKAIVTLAEGSDIEFFDETGDAEDEE